MKRRTGLALALLRGALQAVAAVSPRLAGQWLYHLWFETRRFAEPAREAHWRRSCDELSLPWDDGPLKLYSWGRGPSVLLLHGWNGRGTQLGALAIALAKAGYRALALDAPAHGRSPGNRTNIFEIIDAVNRLSAAFGPLHAVVAHSLGAMVVARALRDGLTAGKVVCIAPPARLEFLIDSFCRHLRAPARARTVLVQLLARRFGGDIETAIATDLNAARLTVPALIIHDQDDRDVPWQQGEAVAQAWPNARFLLTRGLGHNRLLRDEQVIRAALELITG